MSDLGRALTPDEVLDRLDDGSWMCRHCGHFAWSISVPVCPECRRHESDPTDEERAAMEREEAESSIEIHRAIRRGEL